MKNTLWCPYCQTPIDAPNARLGSPFYTAVATGVKEFPPEHADVLCIESSIAFLPEIEYQTRCQWCGRNILVLVQDIDLRCDRSKDNSNLLKIEGYKSYCVTKPESPNVRETRGLQEFLTGPEASQAQYFFKVIHGNHVHAFCSRCGGPVMITFHGLDAEQESFEFTCRQCGKHGNYKREPSDFEDKPLIESTRKNP